MPDLPFSRSTELTALSERGAFERPPSLVSHPHDLVRWKIFRGEYHAAHSLDHVNPDFPLQLDFELNSTCNMACSFCTHGVVKVAKRILPFRDFKRVIDEAAGHHLCSVKLNYINEPLLRKDLPEFVKYARSNGVLNVYFATNGVLLRGDLARRLIDEGTSKIMISLDAASSETFTAMRGNGQFNLIRRNIMEFFDLRENMGVKHPVVRVNFLKTKLNIHEAELFVTQWKGVADVIAFQDRVGLPGIDDPLENSAQGLFKDRTDFKCSFPSKLLVIDSAGAILPCCTFNGRLMPLGNIATMTIAHAWTGRKIRELRALHLLAGYKQNSICRRCVNGCSS